MATGAAWLDVRLTLGVTVIEEGGRGREWGFWTNLVRGDCKGQYHQEHSDSLKVSWNHSPVLPVNRLMTRPAQPCGEA